MRKRKKILPKNQWNKDEESQKRRKKHEKKKEEITQESTE